MAPHVDLPYRAIKGCLDHLGVNVSPPRLFGATGHAFILNVNDAVCPSGPTARNTHMIHQLGRNLGHVADGVFAVREDDDFEERKGRAWEMVKRAIDDSRPCYGWELKIPELYVIFGYAARDTTTRDRAARRAGGPKPGPRWARPPSAASRSTR